MADAEVGQDVIFLLGGAQHPARVTASFGGGLVNLHVNPDSFSSNWFESNVPFLIQGGNQPRAWVERPSHTMGWAN